MSHQLSRSLTIFRGTGILLNIVIGAGLLSLPGLAIQEVGDNAFYAWLLCAAAALPLVGVFILLARLYPNAGGIAFYAQRAFGPFGRRSTAYLMLGAVIFGLPSIALTGGHYLASVFPGDPNFYALVLMGLSGLPHLFRGEGVGRILGWMASGVLVSIIAFLLIGIGSIDFVHTSFNLPAFDLAKALLPFPMIFFAFTGWEIGAGLGEEFINAKRNFPIAMVLSLFIVTALYLAIAYISSLADLSGHYESPFIVFVRPIVGDYGAIGVALVATLIILANLSGALWGVSRLIYSLGRDGVLSQWFSKTYYDHPLRALVATLLSLVAVLLIDKMGLLDLKLMLRLAGQNFLILYGAAALALFCVAENLVIRVVAMSVIAIVGLLLFLQGAFLLYPISLVLLAALLEFKAAQKLGYIENISI